jgi:hypothetical protein
MSEHRLPACVGVARGNTLEIMGVFARLAITQPRTMRVMVRVETLSLILAHFGGPINPPEPALTSCHSEKTQGLPGFTLG